MVDLYAKLNTSLKRITVPQATDENIFHHTEYQNRGKGQTGAADMRVQRGQLSKQKQQISYNGRESIQRA